MARRRDIPKRKILPDPKFRDRLVAKFAGLEVPVLSARHLVKNKRTVARAQD